MQIFYNFTYCYLCLPYILSLINLCSHYYVLCLFTLYGFCCKTQLYYLSFISYENTRTCWFLHLHFQTTNALRVNTTISWLLPNNLATFTFIQGWLPMCAMITLSWVEFSFVQIHRVYFNYHLKHKMALHKLPLNSIDPQWESVRPAVCLSIKIVLSKKTMCRNLV